ncbi:MAG: peptidoglycan DD-metalloendopeptidase family protein [Methylococcaceae bacterium]
MKNKTYTSLLLGISTAFIVSSNFAYAKPIAKHATKAIVTSSTSEKKSKSISKKQAAIINRSNSKVNATNSSNNSSKKASYSKIKPNQNKQAKHTSNKNRISDKTNDLASLSTTRLRSIIASPSSKTASIQAFGSNYRHRENRNKTSNLSLSQTIAEADQIISTPDNHEIQPQLIQQPTQIAKLNSAYVNIETSLFLDGLEAGLSKEVITQLTNIFAWDIDFATNLQPGDRFTVIYEKKTIDGIESETDEIVAAEFTSQGNTYAAVRYRDKSGNTSYYTPDGRSMQKAFLSTPVDFAQISSPFDMHRKHPILNRIRAHKGVDYAARTGTPVKTTGDGMVTFCGREGGYGQVVIIQHGDRYETLYAHLSNFKKGLNEGVKVKQGDIIGYVGQTGLATGPHLHYEFHMDGIYRNPETVKLPHTLPIDNALMADFKAQTLPFVTQLAQIKAKTLFAKSTSRFN